MKIHVNLRTDDLTIDETIEGADAADILRQSKVAVAEKLGFLAGAFVRSMGDVQFAQEVVRRYNSAFEKDCALPSTPDEFVTWAVAEKLATVIEE